MFDVNFVSIDCKQHLIKRIQIYIKREREREREKERKKEGNVPDYSII
jgi:hypothetical protein